MNLSEIFYCLNPKQKERTSKRKSFWIKNAWWYCLSTFIVYLIRFLFVIIWNKSSNRKTYMCEKHIDNTANIELVFLFYSWSMKTFFHFFYEWFFNWWKIDWLLGTFNEPSASFTDLENSGSFSRVKFARMSMDESRKENKCWMVVLWVVWSPKNSTDTTFLSISVMYAGQLHQPRILHKTTSPT